jgi:hypothetical protein
VLPIGGLDRRPDPIGGSDKLGQHLAEIPALQHGDKGLGHLRESLGDILTVSDLT